MIEDTLTFHKAGKRSDDEHRLTPGKMEHGPRAMEQYDIKIGGFAPRDFQCGRSDTKLGG